MKDLKKVLKIFFNKYWPFLIIILLVTVFFWKFFIKGLIPIPGDFIVGTYYPWLDYKWGYPAGVPVKNPITSDVVSFSYPMRILAIDILKSGHVPLWNPLILTGTPLLANFQSAPFTITNIFYFIMNDHLAWSFQVITQHFLAALFTYMLLRSFKLNILPSIMGGIVYAFSGFNLIWSQWNSHTLVASFIPLLVLLMNKYFLTGSYKFGLLFSFSLLFQILAGYPQAVLYTYLILFLFFLFSFKAEKVFLKNSLHLFLYAVLGVGMAFFQILPAKELLDNSQRFVELNPDNWAFLPWEKIVTFLAPDYFGNHATGNYWGPQDYTSNIGFVGIGSLTLSLLAMTNYGKKSNLLLKYAFTAGIISLLLSLNTPFSRIIWNSNLLGLKAAAAHRALILWNFSVAIMAGFGLNLLMYKKNIKIKPILFAPLVLLFAYLIYSLVRHGETKLLLEYNIAGVNMYKVGLRNLVLPSIIGTTTLSIIFFIRKIKHLKIILLIILFSIIVLEVYRFGWKYTPFSETNIIYPTTPVLNFLSSQEIPFRTSGVKVIPMNMRMPYGIETLEGYDAVYPKDIAQFLASSGSGSEYASAAGRYGFVDRIDSPLVDLVNTEYFLVNKIDDFNKISHNGEIPEEFKTDKYKLAFEDGSVVVLKNNEALPRSVVFENWQIDQDKKSILRSLLNPSFPLRNTVILEENPNIMQKSDTEDRNVQAAIKYLKYSPSESVMFVRSQGGVLFTSDLYYPGWKVYVDGIEGKIIKADYAFRGVVITEGEHIVRYLYKPESFTVGLIISIVSFCFLLMYNLFHRNKLWV